MCLELDIIRVSPRGSAMPRRGIQMIFRYGIAGFTLVFALTAWDCVSALAQSPGEPPAITVSGEGEVKGTPNLARILAAVVTHAPSAQEAISANSKEMARVFRALEDLGVASTDIQTSGFAVSPRYGRYGDSNQPAEIVGYEASNQVTVVIRGIDRVGEILDWLVRAGANQISGITFTVDNPVALLDEARQLAVADARRRAELYASAAGVELGRVLWLREGGGHTPVAFESPRAMSAVPVAPGEVTYRANIRASFAIE